ncbi:MAG TPA: hypothetical protein VH092_29555 [Urbifossiella sp.]|jgi:hypothetical protein|nr:hypothetical protein [Urbifossiella sp.]
MLLTFVLVFIALFALLWIVTTVAQGYFYQQPVDRLPLRSAGAALLVAGYLTFWVALDRRTPGKYDTFFEFAPYTTAGFNEFEAVRWEADPASRKGEFKKDGAGKAAETTTHYKRAGGKTSRFVDDKGGKEFILSDGGMLTAAVVLKPDEGGGPVRFDAVFREDKRTGTKTYPPKGDEYRRFAEPKGSRYVMLDQPGVIYVPSTGAVILALLINLGLFVAWFAAFWPVLRFGAGLALLLTLAFGLLTMFAVMPVLFKPGRAAPLPPEAAALAPRASRPVPG